MKKKIYYQAPLPFVGQKRMFLKHFESILQDNIEGDGEGWTIVDVFGGSGLLSHTAKRLKPKARVIYNDFDDYCEKLKQIPEVNRLRRLLIEAIPSDIPSKGKIPEVVKARLIEIIKPFENKVDVLFLSRWLLFSGQVSHSYDKFYRCNFHNNIRKSDYEIEGWFNGFEVVKQDFKALLPQFKHSEKTLLLLDPPYLVTDFRSYKMDWYFDLVEFLKLIDLIRPPFIFFSSTESEFIRFIDWAIDSKNNNYPTFEGYQRIVINAQANTSGGYEDNLVFKF